MVPLQQMADLAAWHDTTVAWAFRRALLVRGVVVRLPRTRRHAHDRDRAWELTRRELRELMANRASPMDWSR
jgi:hypothetical protein